MNVGDRVEYVVSDECTGVVGVITGFVDDRARVLCPSGHEWLLRVKSLMIVEEVKEAPVSPSRVK